VATEPTFGLRQEGLPRGLRVDETLVRGQDYQLVGDASKARARLGWKPTVTFVELVGLLVDAARAA